MLSLANSYRSCSCIRATGQIKPLGIFCTSQCSHRTTHGLGAGPRVWLCGGPWWGERRLMWGYWWIFLLLSCAHWCNQVPQRSEHIHGIIRLIIRLFHCSPSSTENYIHKRNAGIVRLHFAVTSMFVSKPHRFYSLNEGEGVRLPYKNSSEAGFCSGRLVNSLKTSSQNWKTPLLFFFFKRDDNKKEKAVLILLRPDRLTGVSRA